MNVENVLVDARNIDYWLPHLTAQCSVPNALIAMDIETHDRDRHEGLGKLLKIDDDGFNKSNKLVFDFKRSTLCGTSLHFGVTEPGKAYYLNTGHADVENRIPVSVVLELFDAVKKAGGTLICHNVAYEAAIFLGSYDYELPNTLCSMQLCVSAYGPDEYPKSKLKSALAKGIQPILEEIDRNFYQIEDPKNLTFKQWETLNKFISKASNSTWSYEGIVKSISYGYGLKKAVLNHFGHQMDDFKKTLGDAPDMGALTGEQVLSYGIEDSVWCYRLFMKVYKSMSPELMKTYMEQENPCTRLFARATIGGLKVNLPEVYKARDRLRKEVAQILLQMKAEIRKVMPKETPEFHLGLVKYEKWYKHGSHEKYFRGIWDWLNAPDDVDDYSICTQVRCSVGNSWVQDIHGANAKTSATMSVGHYMFQRYLFFVIFGMEITTDKGKIQTDKVARAGMGDFEILKLYAKLGDVEQAIKLFVNNYIFLTDPEDNKVHPIMSSLLATRRSSCQGPNLQQASKRGASKFIRSYFVADDEDSLLVSADWAAVELLAIGAASQDPEFLKAFSQRPAADLHSVAAAGALGMSVEEFKKLPNAKELRTTAGKTSSFGYWYSGWLGSTAKAMSWTFEETVDAVNGYREKFSIGEAWRLKVIDTVREKGFVTLPDHHTRVRYEATTQWAEDVMEVFNSYGSEAITAYGQQAVRKIQTRAGNQAVNSLIQGNCAALAKRTMLNLEKILKDRPTLRARFIVLIHDELLVSVHKDDALEFTKILYDLMIADSDLMPNVKLDTSVAIGYNFLAYHPTENPRGQIETSELPELPFLPTDRINGKATEDEMKQIIDYLTNRG